MLQLILEKRLEDKLDVISCVFKIKLNYLMNDIKKHEYFDTYTALLYTIEF